MNEKNEKKQIATMWLATVLIIILIAIIVGLYVKIIQLKKEANVETKQQTESELEYAKEENNENTETTTKTVNKTDSDAIKGYLRIIDRTEENKSNETITYDLIYFNDDEILDLVVSNNNNWMSLYLYENGTTDTLAGKWKYGISGNSGYRFKEKSGVIVNNQTEFAGGIINTTIYKLNAEKKFDVLKSVQKGATVEDTSTMEEIENELTKNGGYFYNDEKISEQEYKDKLKELSIETSFENYVMLQGNMSANEAKEKLNISANGEAATQNKDKTGYTDSELIEMTKAYRKAKGLYVPSIVEIGQDKNDEVMIHLYDINSDNVVVTTDWYTVNRNTGKGTNVLNEEIDLTDKNVDNKTKSATNTQENNKDDAKFSEAEIKQAIQNYLDLRGALDGSPVGFLKKLGFEINYDETLAGDEHYYKTDYTYLEYKQKMLNYVTEEWFENKFTRLVRNVDGILYYENVGGSGEKTEVESVSLKGDYSNLSYIANVYDVHFDETKEQHNVEFHIANYNNKCVISYCDR